MSLMDSLGRFSARKRSGCDCPSKFLFCFAGIQSCFESWRKYQSRAERQRVRWNWTKKGVNVMVGKMNCSLSKKTESRISASLCLLYQQGHPICYRARAPFLFMGEKNSDSFSRAWKVPDKSVFYTHSGLVNNHKNRPGLEAR